MGWCQAVRKSRSEATVQSEKQRAAKDSIMAFSVSWSDRVTREGQKMLRGMKKDSLKLKDSLNFKS